MEEEVAESPAPPAPLVEMRGFTSSELLVFLFLYWRYLDIVDFSDMRFCSEAR